MATQDNEFVELRQTIELRLTRMRQLIDEPKMVRLWGAVSVEVRPAEDDDRVVVMEDTMGCAVVNYTSEGVMVDVFGVEDIEPVASMCAGLDDLVVLEDG